MNVTLLILVFATCCVCDNTKLTLDIEINADRSKFTTISKEYQGIPYNVYLPLPGYEIYNVVIGDRSVYRGTPERRRINFVMAHYSKAAGNAPVFLLRSEWSRFDHIPNTGRTQVDGDNLSTLLLLMRCIRDLFPDDQFIQEQLKYLDRTEFPIRTTNKLAYDIFYGEKHIEGLPDDVALYDVD